MQEFDFLRPASLQELVDALNRTGGCVIAGGTDIIPKMRRDLFSASIVVDASHVTELGFIEETDDEISIGALTTHQELADSTLLQAVNPALVAAAVSVGCNQTRQRGTLGGNIANAS
ncbi:MAG: FAD binding domain-containing protein, partial [Chloroflexota bacterium]